MNKIEFVKKGVVFYLYGAIVIEVIGTIYHFIG